MVIFLFDPKSDEKMIQHCKIDPREELVGFVGWILGPIALARSVIYLSYRAPHHYQTFVSFSFALSVYWNTSFGFWTIENFVRIFSAPPACGKSPIQLDLYKTVYHIVLIIGACPAVVFVFGLIFFIFFIPFSLYERFQKR